MGNNFIRKIRCTESTECLSAWGGMEFHLIQVTGRQHHRCIIPQAVNIV